MKQLTLVVAALVLAAPAVFAANSVLVESKTVQAGATDVQIGIFVSNDETIQAFVCPLIIRSTAGGAFIDRLAIRPVPGSRFEGRLELVRAYSGFITPSDTACRSHDVRGPGFRTVAWSDTLSHLLTESPAGCHIARVGQTADLPPGTDAAPCFRLLVDVNAAASGTFEVDTTCTAPNNHLVFVRPGAIGILPSFTKGIITVTGGSNPGCECPNNGDITDDGTTDVIDVVALIDYVFSSGSPPPADEFCPLINRGDVNCDGIDDIFDILYLIDFAFKGGPLPCGSCPCGPEWTRRYDGNPSVSNSAQAIQVDSSGMVYVTGYTWDWNTGPPYASSLKYSPSGSTLWERQDHGGGDELPYAMELDHRGNLYIAGVVASGGGGGYLTLKYDTAGNLRWRIVRYFGTGHSRAKALAIDSHGNVFVTGESRETDLDSYDYGIMKYDSTGSLLWERHFGPGEASAIAVDPMGNSYVTGSAGTVKHDPSGNKLWRDPEPGADITLDPGGNSVYVTGSSTRKYDNNGRPQWSDPRTATKIRTDAAGNVYTAGTAVRKYNGGGQLLWENFTSAVAIQINASGDVVVAGSSTTAFDANGHVLWQTDIPGVDLGLDALGNVYVTRTAGSDFVTSKMSSAGPCAPLRIKTISLERNQRE